jgi:hypothetical protein
LKEYFGVRDTLLLEYLERGFNGNGNEFRVIKTSSEQEKIVLLIIEKKALGRWEISSVANASNTGYAVIGWMKSAGIRRFDIKEDSVFETEAHLLYYGNDATGYIDIDSEKLPSGVAVNVRQSGGNYSIHFVSYGDLNGLNEVAYL